ncbi:hypothetical protein WR25_12233 [Diploscapter pachys]|uniref:E3 ubiquitin-protein ligase n=1 Tax=Diploscapter pachys TaxID=2018661 RepID=A0A2A2KBX0_9BILA|nr:hypothetical protein WR25_12233 [Diploscapter pachys]
MTEVSICAFQIESGELAAVVKGAKTREFPLSSEPITWRPFVLLDLPDKYDRLFARYFQRPCRNCNKPPPNPMVCLLCGELCCLDDCCRVHASPPSNEEAQEQTPPIVEVERHASECGNGACVFISLNSSLIAIVRYKLAAIWGSVYLDAHGEEDRNLRRGKPLFLSERRMKCLYSDWAEQEWIRAGNWLPLITLVNALKESHFAYRLKTPDISYDKTEMSELLAGIELEKYDKSKHNASEVLKDKVVALYFSAHWCPPCRNFTPMLKTFYDELKSSGEFEVVFISYDRNEQDLKSYMKEAHGDWYHISFKHPKIQELASKYGVNGIPALIIIKPDGEIITKEGRTNVQAKTSPKVTISEWKSQMN